MDKKVAKQLRRRIYEVCDVRKVLDEDEWEHLKRRGLIADNEKPSEISDYTIEDINKALDDIEEYFQRKLAKLNSDAYVAYKPVHRGDESSRPLDETFGHLPLGGSTRLLARAEALHDKDRATASVRDVPFRQAMGAACFLSGWGYGIRPEWIALVGAPIWTPADEIKRAHEVLQGMLLESPRAPKVREKTYRAAHFVWKKEQILGKRPQWRSLMEEWNRSVSSEDRFKDERSFRKCVLDGQRTTTPVYAHSENQLRKLMDNGEHLREFDKWIKNFRNRLGREPREDS